MKGDQAAVVPIQPVMGHHHHQNHHHPSQQQQQLLVNHKTPQALAMDAHPVHEALPQLTAADNCSSTPLMYTNAAPVTGSSAPPGQVSLHQFKELEDECLSLKDSNLKMKQQLVDSQRRERLMMRRLAAKEQELLDYVNQVAELKSVQTPAQNALKTAMLDPAVNVLFQKLKQELQATQARLEETQNELAAWKFTPDSNTGKRLMAKCRLLHQENEELGKLTSNGRLAKLESELAMQKGVSEDLKKSHCDLDEVLVELEEDVEGMQNTILLMQRELKVEKERNQSVERENGRMMTVLRDKPEWLAVVQARQEEAAAAERLKLEQEGGERRLNGGGGAGGGGGGGIGLMEVDDDDHNKDTSALDTGLDAMALRMRSGAVQSRTTGPDDVQEGDEEFEGGDLVQAANGKATEVNNICSSGSISNSGTNNGQSMMMATRKRTRSSVAVAKSAGVTSAGAGGGGVVDGGEAPEQGELMSVAEEQEEGANCAVSGGKRNRFNNASGGDQQPQQQPQGKSAPRTRGQLLQMNEAAKLGDEVLMMTDDAAKVENGAVVVGDGGNVQFGGSGNNNNNTLISNNGSSNKAAEEENGTGDGVDVRKLKLENGAGAGVAAAAATGCIDLRQENTSA